MAAGTTFRVSVDTLDEHFVESLREKYPHASLEIKVNAPLRPDVLSEEALLRIARVAYQRKTGQPFRYIPAFNFETFSNRSGWTHQR